MLALAGAATIIPFHLVVETREKNIAVRFEVMPGIPAAKTQAEGVPATPAPAGASAVATALFTQAFRYGDPVTPLVLQKLQPVIAVVAAALLLGWLVEEGIRFSRDRRARAV